MTLQCNVVSHWQGAKTKWYLTKPSTYKFRRYSVTSSLIGTMQTQNDPWQSHRHTSFSTAAETLYVLIIRTLSSPWVMVHNVLFWWQINRMIPINQDSRAIFGKALNICHSRQSTLIHLRLDKMAAISQTTVWNAFSWIKSVLLRFKFHWSLFPRVQLTIFQHWFR